MTQTTIRILDILFSLTGLILLIPVFIIITVLGLIDTGSPIFIQQRVGKRLRPFKLIKFRTMTKNTDQKGTHLICEKSITSLGKILRKTKLDELPQLINVLTGDMSLVGPRPGLFNQQQLIEERKKRNVYLTSPGITGLGQINKIDMSTPKKLARYDVVMITNMNLQLYIKILAVTALGKGSGDRTRPRH